MTWIGLKSWFSNSMFSYLPQLLPSHQGWQLPISCLLANDQHLQLFWAILGIPWLHFICHQRCPYWAQPIWSIYAAWYNHRRYCRDNRHPGSNENASPDLNHLMVVHLLTIIYCLTDSFTLRLLSLSLTHLNHSNYGCISLPCQTTHLPFQCLIVTSG